MQVEIDFSQVEKKLKRIPKNIRLKISRWGTNVLYLGVVEVRKIPGYHDEWFRYRSVRLNLK